VPVKDFENQSIIGEDMDISQVAHFYGPQCTLKCFVILVNLFNCGFVLFVPGFSALQISLTICTTTGSFIVFRVFV